MCPPEDIPEDREQSFPCPSCNDGSVVLAKGVWGCSTCGWEAPQKSDETAVLNTTQVKSSANATAEQIAEILEKYERLEKLGKLNYYQVYNDLKKEFRQLLLT